MAIKVRMIVMLLGKKTGNESVTCSVMSDSLHPVDCSPQASLSMDFSSQEHWSG